MDRIDSIRQLMLFETFSDDQLNWLAAYAREITFGAAEQVFGEGQPAEALWVLIEGEWRISRMVGDFDMPLATTAQAGTWGGGVPIFDGSYPISAWTTKDSRLLWIPNEAVRHMLTTGFPIAIHLLAGLSMGARRSEALKSQYEKLTALGKLAAGLAHELNNPAAAARRAAAQIQEVLRDQQDAILALATSDAAIWWQTQLDLLRTEMLATTQHDVPLSPLERADREDDLAAWLEEHGIVKSAEAATMLIDMNLSITWLESAAARVAPEVRPALIRWIAITASELALGEQLKQSLIRISTLIAAVKSYSYMDQAPLQEIDVHDGLDSTLIMMQHRLNEGVTVVKNYDRSVPRIPAYGSELNQVWTNLIDNALDAMGGKGRLTIRTTREQENVLVEIVDTGAGIPASALPHIFEPFFTTKGVGEGTGLGLEICFRIVTEQHHGNIEVNSEPGDTHFLVRLPIHERNHL